MNLIPKLHSEQHSPEEPQSDNKNKEVNEKIKINFASWNTTARGNTIDLLLDQAEEAGLILPYSCRGGMCGCCKVKLESCEVDQLCQDGLTDTEQQQDYILACSCIPKSDIVITKA